MEPVVIKRFIPLPDGGEERTIRLGQFGKLEVLVVDPYSIALREPDRGCDTDLDDLVFLVRKNLVEVQLPERMTEIALSRVREFEMNSTDMVAPLRELKNRLS